MKPIIVRNAVSKELCEFLSLEFTMMEQVCKLLFPPEDFTDLCPNSFAKYCPLMFEALSVKLLPLVEEKTLKKLEPTYSYARIYYHGSELKIHKDRQSSEVTISLCVEKDAVDWPIFIKEEDGSVTEVLLNVGDLVIYSGRKSEHWRDPFKGSRQVQCFLQYVDINGADAFLKWDTRPCLGLPFDYASPELRRIGELENGILQHGLLRKN
jgi:hypothetical protein